MKASTLFGSTSILLIDGVGALLTALGVGVVLPALQPWFGVPIGVSRVLGAIALAFAAFSLGRYLSKTAAPSSLRHIAIANLAYCAVTAAVLVVHRGSVTALAYVYFLGEILIVVLLARRELWLARQLERQPS